VTPDASDRRHRSTPHSVLVASLVSSVFLVIATALASPGPVLGATTTKVAACSANLRTSTSSSATTKTTISTGTKVSVVARVTGSSWTVSCAGASFYGRYWYRISAINGTSVKSRYGVSYLYAPYARFNDSPFVDRYAKCSLHLRKGASGSTESLGSLRFGVKVSVAAVIGGKSWSTTCGGSSVSGLMWYRIRSINGQSVRSLFGVSYVYSATGMFSSGPPPSPYVEGIDVSHWQGTIDWTKVWLAGKRFAFMKATEGKTYDDPTYPTNRTNANGAGLRIGAYHFARPGTDVGDATIEADHFIATAKWAPGDLRPVLDLEQSGGMSVTALQTWVRTFLDRIYATKRVRAVIYVSPAFWSKYMGNSTWFAANGYDVLWIAHWTTAAGPTTPAGNWGGHGWTFWQYTSDGSVPGIVGRVDLDRYNGTNLESVDID
jgi:GH25 family lysozyme M1 (1,4-beta-N-acetylmuramidase)